MKGKELKEIENYGERKTKGKKKCGHLVYF